VFAGFENRATSRLQPKQAIYSIQSTAANPNKAGTGNTRMREMNSEHSR
jgi:hypothetical protein